MKVGGRDTGHGHGHGHDDLSDEGALEDFTLSEEPSETPQQGHSHGKPVDIRDFFDPDDLAQQYNLHQEANKIDLAAMTEEIVLSKDNQGIRRRGQPGADRDRPAAPRRYAGADLASSRAPRSTPTCRSRSRTRCWAGSTTSRSESQEGTEDDAAALRRRLTGVLAGLPEAIKTPPGGADGAGAAGGGEPRPAGRPRWTGSASTSAMELEESIRRLARSLHGGLTHKRKVASRGRIDSGRTMRRNMRFDGIPFSPITVARTEDKPRLVILTDVSLSVRATARFTLHLVHGLQNLFGQVRAFAFVADLVEITDLFEDHPVEPTAARSTTPPSAGSTCSRTPPSPTSPG